MVYKHKYRKKRNFKYYVKSNNELNDLIAKNSKKLLKQEKEEDGKISPTFSGNVEF